MGLFDRFKKKDAANVMPINPDYTKLWARCQLDTEPSKIAEIDGALNIFLANYSRYEYVATLTSINPFFIFCLHYKEASCSFKRALHNGDDVIGNGKKTYNVPKGRGPFNTWEAAAVDALLLEGAKVRISSVIIPMILESAEYYNGIGHRKHGELSPYVWAYTNNHDETGNFVSDGKYSSTAPVKSAGVAALFKRAIELGILSVNHYSTGDCLLPMGVIVGFKVADYKKKMEMIKRDPPSVAVDMRSL